jgi:peptidoglycan/LPS O-acetylase OafA/YrhL
VLLVIVGIILVKTIILAFDGILDPQYWDIVIRFFAMTKLESMAIGGLGAWALFYKKERILQWAYHPVAQGTAYLGIPFLLYFTPAMLQNGIHLVYSVLFLVIIVNVSTNPKSWLKLEHPILHSLGKISYGLYMYHMLVIVAVIHILAPLLPEDSRNGVGAALLFYTASFTISIAISYLSYRFFELRFIRMKGRYTKVSSGDDARIQ